MKKLVCIAMLLASPAFAGDPPTELTKKQALIQAYRLNGNSMVRWGAIDLTVPEAVDVRGKDEIVCGWVKGEATGTTFYECHDMISPSIPDPLPEQHSALSATPPPEAAQKAIKTVTIEPEPVTVPKSPPDICKRHGLRKVYNKDGDYWNCRRR
jgi:hypothetical protein